MLKFTFKNFNTYKGEKVADIIIKSQSKINAINCPPNLNSAAIDEFLLIFRLQKLMASLTSRIYQSSMKKKVPD